MTEDQYRAQYHEDDAVGWDAINAALETLYGDREPRHYASIVKYAIGGKDPLDGTSIYDCDEQTYHRHLISYGMSELYFDPESADVEYSGWGFEFTMRIAPCAEDQIRNGAEHEPVWVINLMNNLARYVFDSENWFEPYHFITANGPPSAPTPTPPSSASPSSPTPNCRPLTPPTAKSNSCNWSASPRPKWTGSTRSRPQSAAKHSSRGCVPTTRCSSPTCAAAQTTTDPQP